MLVALRSFGSDSARDRAAACFASWIWLAMAARTRSAAPILRRPTQYINSVRAHMYGWKSMNLAFCWWISGTQA